jgi:hypothetical protein
MVILYSTKITLWQVTNQKNNLLSLSNNNKKDNWDSSKLPPVPSKSRPLFFY